MLIEVYYMSGNYEKFLYNCERCENERRYYLLGKYYQTVEINYDKAINNYLKYLNFLLNYHNNHVTKYLKDKEKTEKEEKEHKNPSTFVDYYLNNYKFVCNLNKDYKETDDKITETRQLILECYKLKDLDSKPAPVLTEFVSLLTDI
jgi:hypothetical protein